MTELADVLTARSATSDDIQYGLMYYLAENTDLSPDEMRSEMERFVADPAVLDAEIDRLARDAILLDNAALWALSAAWPDEQDRITTILDHVGSKLPLVEATVIAISIVYALYLVVTRGRRRTVKRVEIKPDGSFVSHEETTYSDPSGIFSALIGQFKSSREPADPG